MPPPSQPFSKRHGYIGQTKEITIRDDAPKDLRFVFLGIYGYASDEGARHGKEGTEPTGEEAEFAVAVCAAVCALLTRKRRGPELPALSAGCRSRR
jgi:hypothetical protein